MATNHTNLLLKILELDIRYHTHKATEHIAHLNHEAEQDATDAAAGIIALLRDWSHDTVASATLVRHLSATHTELGATGDPVTAFTNLKNRTATELTNALTENDAPQSAFTRATNDAILEGTGRAHQYATSVLGGIKEAS